MVRKNSKTTKGGWNCPHCPIRSSRHWNAKRHIERYHGGIGEPVHEYSKMKPQSCYYNSPNQFKEPRFGSIQKHGMHDRQWWDFIDDILEPAKKLLEFNKVMAELSMPNQQFTSPPSPIYQYPRYLSNPMNINSVGSLNIDSSNNDSNSQESIQLKVMKGQLYARGVDLLESYLSRNRSKTS
ncbi:MAG TPA: hypothetical protein VFD60_03145 [Nitrososphaeraceae archaeon]|jgi:hypothetical protein|nr:hypothetical protein [Nitrososphaeraceae archaeon]